MSVKSLTVLVSVLTSRWVCSWFGCHSVTWFGDLSPSLHISNIVAKAHKRTAAIYRAFRSRSADLLIRAYFTYVRPLVEHDSVIWYPYTVKDIEAIETVQRRFTKRLPKFSLYLTQLHWTTKTFQPTKPWMATPSCWLDLLLQDSIWTHWFTSQWVLCESSLPVTKSYSYKLYKKHSSSTVRAKFFSEQTVSMWNNLPDIIDFSMLTSFICTFKTIDLSEHLRYC